MFTVGVLKLSSLSLFFLQHEVTKKEILCLTQSKGSFTETVGRVHSGVWHLNAELDWLSCCPYRTKSSSVVPRFFFLQRRVCIQGSKLRSGWLSFSALFLRLQQTTVTAMMMPISIRMRKMAAAITPTEYSVQEKTRHEDLDWSLLGRTLTTCPSGLQHIFHNIPALEQRINIILQVMWFLVLVFDQCRVKCMTFVLKVAPKER